jgi:hypothetical protein
MGAAALFARMACAVPGPVTIWLLSRNAKASVIQLLPNDKRLVQSTLGNRGLPESLALLRTPRGSRVMSKSLRFIIILQCFFFWEGCVEVKQVNPCTEPKHSTRTQF